jgi:C-terminal processing protease CtpA/Prc
LKLPLKNYPGFYDTQDKVSFYFSNDADLVLKSLFILPSTSNIFFSLTKKNKGKVVVLIDEYTKSWGESMTLALREYVDDVTLIGRNTNGSNGNAGSVVLPANLEMTFTHYRVDAEGGVSYQHRGIPPDIYVEEEIPSQENPNPDPIMTTALNYLFNEKALVK